MQPFILALAASIVSVTSLTLTGDEVWVVSPQEQGPASSAILLAQKDAYFVLGIVPVVLSAPPIAGSLPQGSVVVYMGSIQAAPWLDLFDLTGCMTGWESHCVKAFPAESNGSSGYASIIATGEGMRGVIYGALSFSESVLGVNPWALFTDDPTAYVGSVSLDDNLALTWSPPQFKWRGLFFNDEVNGYFDLRGQLSNISLFVYPGLGRSLVAMCSLFILILMRMKHYEYFSRFIGPSG